MTRFRRRLQKQRNWLLAGGIVILVGVMSLEFESISSVNPRAYTPLLSTIAKGESGGNYNAYFGNPRNSSVRFTDMTVGEVLKWQDDHVSKGNISNAVGKYQIIRPTLAGLVDSLQVDLNEKFDEATQDRMAIALLEQRGAVEYVNDKLSKEQFAANLAMEWAALPKVVGGDPQDSYYAADGVNKSNISVNEVYGALDSLQALAKENHE